MKVGSLAMLKSGGPLMKVICVKNGEALCKWELEDGTKALKSFPVACLESPVQRAARVNDHSTTAFHQSQIIARVLPAVRVFNDLKEGEGPPEGTFQDSSIHTVICHRAIRSGGSSTTIFRRCAEEPEVRDYVDPMTWDAIRVETTRWDVTNLREPCALHPEGISCSSYMYIPTHPL